MARRRTPAVSSPVPDPPRLVDYRSGPMLERYGAFRADKDAWLAEYGRGAGRAAAEPRSGGDAG